MQTDPEADEDEIFDEYRWNIIYRKKQEQKIAQAFGLFRQNNVEPILFKGWALAAFYPKTKARIASDIDLAVSSRDFAKAEEILRSAEGRKLGIDLHDQLRRHDTVDWTILFANSKTLSADSEQIRVLAPEDHLRVVCAHWLQDGAEYREKLWDVYYLVANRPKTFDWDRCLNMVSSNRQRWIECTMGLAAKYFGLDLSATPFPQADKELPAWLIRTVETIWANDVRLEPLHALTHDPRKFLRQLKKRIPPNPIQATIEAEGSFDAKWRGGYQLASMLRRFPPSVRSIGRSLRRK